MMAKSADSTAGFLSHWANVYVSVFESEHYSDGAFGRMFWQSLGGGQRETLARNAQSLFPIGGL